MKTKIYQIQITGSKVIGIDPIDNITGEIFEAKFNEEVNLFYINSKKHGGQIGIRGDECKVLSN